MMETMVPRAQQAPEQKLVEPFTTPTANINITPLIGACQEKTNLKDLVEQIKERLDIVEVIGTRIELDRNNKALCPFHSEKTPSFSVNANGQYFHCFGCGAGGDVIRFIELYENKTFTEALKELAKQAGISLNISAQDVALIEEERTLQNILLDTAEFYHKNLTQQAKEYLQSRGFSDETIKRFKLGFADWGLWEHLKKKYPLELCLKAGVLKRATDGNIKDYFYNRIIFPVFYHGRVVNLSGRSIDSREPKYLHLSGEMHHLYNEDALINSKTVLIAEGIPDCLSALQAGIPSVAVLGTSVFKAEYLPKFDRCDTVYICLDGDSAGQQGAIKIAELIGERARIVQMPQGTDINEYLQSHTKEDFEQLIASAKDIIKYQISLILQNIDKTDLPQKLEPILKRLAKMDKVRAEAYLNYEIKQRFKLNREDLAGYRALLKQYRGEVETPSPHTNKDEYIALFDGLVDIVDYKGNPAFLVKDGSSLAILPEFELEGVRYLPPTKEQIPWLLPRAEEVINIYNSESLLTAEKADRALYIDLLTYHQNISELPDEKHYDLLVAWDLHTYTLDSASVRYSPIISLFAVPERGKSRTGKSMIYVAYRGLHVESLREAYIIRMAHHFQASLFFDVVDIWGKAEKNQSEDILLQRFEKGAKVPRVLYPEKGAFRDTVYYNIFGATVIGTNVAANNKLDSRGVTINMPQSAKRFETNVTPENSLPYKERLVAFRARHLNKSFEDIKKPDPNRLGDILKPILQIIQLVNPEREKVFWELLKLIQYERLIEKAGSLEADILKALENLEGFVDGGILPIKVITDEINKDRPDYLKLSYKRIGSNLSALGFKKACTQTGSIAIVWDKKKIISLAEAYGVKL